MSNIDKAVQVIRAHDADGMCNEPECLAQDLADAGLIAPELLDEVIRLREALEDLRDDLAEDGEKIGADQNEQAEFSAHGRIARILTRILEGEKQ